MDESFQTVVLAVGVFHIHQHPEAVLKRDFFHFGIRLLRQKGIGHRAEAHLNQLVNRTLVRHVQSPPVVVRTPGQGIGVCLRGIIRLGFLLVFPGSKNILDALVTG